MPRIPFNKMLIGLDRLYLMTSNLSPEEHAKLIDVYLEGCGWSLDDVLSEMCNEKATPFSTTTRDGKLLS